MVMEWFKRHFSHEFIDGDLCSVRSSDNRFAIAKVLKREPSSEFGDIIHVRTYKQHFSERPSSIDPSTLTIGTVYDTDGFGVGHLPLRYSNFLKWEPNLIQTEPVSPEELDGYQIWKDAGGGVWD